MLFIKTKEKVSTIQLIYGAIHAGNGEIMKNEIVGRKVNRKVEVKIKIKEENPRTKAPKESRLRIRVEKTSRKDMGRLATNVEK